MEVNMRKFNILAIIAAILALSLCVFASCNNGDSGKTSESLSGSAESGETNESSGDTGETGDTGGTESREELAVPQIVLGGDFTVTWTAVDNATGYTVNVNGEDLGVTPSLSFPALKVAGSYAIKVKAIGNGGESGYSNTVNYSVYSVDLATGEGFTLTGDKVVYGGKNYTFTLEIKGEAYSGSVPVVKVNGEAVEAGEDGKYTVGNVSGEIVITVENVKINVYTVSVKEGEGYTVDGEISKEVNYGESVSFAVAATNAEDIIKVFNGEEEIVLVDGVYTLENVKANAELTVRVYDLASQMFTAINLPKTEYDGYVSVGCRVMSIDSAWVEKVIKAGYTHLKFDTKLTGGVSISLTHGGTWNKYWKSLDATDTVRIDLAEFKDENAYYGWSMEVRDSAGNQTDGVVELYNPTLIRSEETAKWTKSNSSIYCAEEDGYIVLDTRCSGNDAHVLSSEAFCAKYFNNTKAKDAASQYTVIFKGRYLYAGSNTRGMVWGDTSSAVSSVGGSANTDFVIEHANNRNDYAAGNKFYMGLDKEGVYQFAMSKFISSRNSWGGFSCTDFDTNTYKGNMVAEQTLVYAEKIEDLIAAGYTKVVITAEYMGGQLWTGSGFGTQWIYGLNNGETKEWDLTSLDTAACPYLIFYCSVAASNATVSVTFVK